MIRHLKHDKECSTCYSDRLQIAKKHDMQHPKYFNVGQNKMTLKAFVLKYKETHFSKSQLKSYKIICDTESLKWHSNFEDTKEIISEPLYDVKLFLFLFYILSIFYINFTNNVLIKKG